MDWLKDWVRDRIADAKGVLSGAIDAVRRALAHALDVLARVLRGVKSAFGGVVNAAKHARNWVTWSIGETFGTLKWLIFTEIPRRAKQAADAAYKAAKGLIDWVYNQAKALVSNLDKWTRATIKTLNDWARAAVKWVTDRANWLYSQWTTFVRDVMPRLLSPSRLVEWLWGQIVAKFWRWLPTQADRVALWVVRRSLAFTRWIAEYIIGFIARML